MVDHANPHAVADEHEEKHGAEIRHVCSKALRGYAARMSSIEAAKLTSDDRVTGVSIDRDVAAYAQSTPTGVDRVDGDCGRNNDDAMHQAMCNSVTAGVTYVVAAGGDHIDAASAVPASYDEVVTISALAGFDGVPGGKDSSTCRSDQDDTLADFSNCGPDVDLIAPGVCDESTWLNGGRHTISGTSMASPHVAGGAALHLANNPGASPQLRRNLARPATLRRSTQRPRTLAD